jgi:hypothetical protein
VLFVADKMPAKIKPLTDMMLASVKSSYEVAKSEQDAAYATNTETESNVDQPQEQDESVLDESMASVNHDDINISIADNNDSSVIVNDQ